MNALLAGWNTAPTDVAEAHILPCNGSPLWASQMAGQRPFASEAALFAASDYIWAGLPPAQWRQAFESHPRLGEKHAEAASTQSLQWSAGEQARLAADADGSIALAEANRLYEQRFGRIFLVCASGKSTAEILAILRQRLAYDDPTELHEAAEQQRRITQLRLRKWLALPAARCEDV